MKPERLGGIDGKDELVRLERLDERARLAPTSQAIKAIEERRAPLAERAHFFFLRDPVSSTSKRHLPLHQRISLFFIKRLTSSSPKNPHPLLERAHSASLTRVGECTPLQLLPHKNKYPDSIGEKGACGRHCILQRGFMFHSEGLCAALWRALVTSL